MKSYSAKGKRFDRQPSLLYGGVDDNLLSYEQIHKVNAKWQEDGKFRNGFCNRDHGTYKLYTPKKTQNRKDVIAAHRRSGKKTERYLAKQDILNQLSEKDEAGGTN